MTRLYFAAGMRRDQLGTFGQPGREVSQLVALQYLGEFEKARTQTRPTSWALDSGAFGGHMTGKPVLYEHWRDAALSCDADEIFGLDVMGDHEATRANCERAWRDGIEAIPTFHVGSPWSALEWAADSAPKIALGGVARLGPGRLHWLEQCFARVWPKRIHGFGVTGRELLLALPFHSVDSSTWSLAPSAFRMFRQYGGGQRQVPGPRPTDLWGEVQALLKHAELAQHRWRREMKQLAELPGWKRKTK